MEELAPATQEEVIPEETEDEKTGGMAAFFDPVVLIFIFPLAVFLDAAGLILTIFGIVQFSFFGITEILSYMTDVIGLIVIGSWCYWHSQAFKVTYPAAKRLTKAMKLARKLRWLRPFLFFLEFIPFVGAAPCWTILVWLELKALKTE